MRRWKVLRFRTPVSQLGMEDVRCVSFHGWNKFIVHLLYYVSFIFSYCLIIDHYYNFRLCGNYGANLKNPYKITSTTNLAAIHFRSSSKNQYKGFSCKWNVERAIPVPYSKEGKFNGQGNWGIPTCLGVCLIYMQFYS